MIQFNFMNHTNSADQQETDCIENIFAAGEEFIPLEPACDTAEELSAPEAEPAEPVLYEEAAPWQPPTVGGCSAPDVQTLKNMLFAAEPLLISLNSRSSLERKPTRDQSVAFTRNFVANSYQAALNNHNLVSRMGRLVFPLPGIWVDDGINRCHVVGTLIPTFNIYNWRFAYTEDPVFTSCFEDECYRGVVDGEADKTVVACTSPAEYLTGCGYRIKQIADDSISLPAALEKLAHQMASVSVDPLVAEFLQHLRTNIALNKPGHYEMGDASPESKKLLTDLARQMQKLGFFSFLTVNTLTEVVNYTLSRNEPCLNFVRGKWLEYFATAECRKVLDSISAEYGLPVQMNTNIELTDPEEADVPCHELDCAFTVGGLFFWIEAKSSSRNLDYDKYRIRGTELQVIPDQFLMLNADLDGEAIEALEWLYPYHVANCTTFAASLYKVVTAALSKTGADDSQQALAA